MNCPMKPRNFKWRLLDRGFRFVVRCGFSKSDLAMGMAHTEGATALHYAAQQVAWRCEGITRARHLHSITKFARLVHRATPAS